MRTLRSLPARALHQRIRLPAPTNDSDANATRTPRILPHPTKPSWPSIDLHLDEMHLQGDLSTRLMPAHHFASSPESPKQWQSFFASFAGVGHWNIVDSDKSD
ncbi:hypothetical protein MW887_002975 [Aspergillus wentii]|nr:hypothetical protein MW887_002975 [Aspergillus wentii]